MTVIDYEGLYKVVTKQLKNYLGCPVIRSNQNEELPKYPFVSYTVTTPKSAYSGTYGEYDDGISRKPVTQTWSITVLSDDDNESKILALKAHEWFDYVGTLCLNDQNVIVQSLGSIGNRDNFLTVEFEHKNGFDVVFWLFDEVNTERADDGEIKTATINEITAEKISVIDSIREAIIASGVDVPEDTDPTQYSALINQACQTQYDKGYNQGFYDNSPDGVIAEIIAIIDESGVLE